MFIQCIMRNFVVAGLQQAFKPFGQVKVEWPGKEGKQNRHPPKGIYLMIQILLQREHVFFGQQ